MLLQSVLLPSCIFRGEENEVWQQHVVALLHLNVLTPILISFDDETALNSLEDKTSIVAARAAQLFHHPWFGVRYESSFDEGVIVRLLDAGAATVILSESTLNNNFDVQESLSSLPRSRIGMTLSLENMERKISKWRDFIGHFFFRIDADSQETTIELVGQIISLIKAIGPSIEIYLEFSNQPSPVTSAVADILNKSEHLHISLKPRLKEQRLSPTNQYLRTVADIIKPETNSSEPQHDLVDYFLLQLKSDRIDGLFTTVVCDERNQILGLVYSNQESIVLAFQEKKGIYWSRSRQTLWRKGESSGMVQYLLDMRLDCDRDALKMRVQQGGQPPAFCHLLSYSCWGHQHGPFSEPGGLQHLQQTLQDRLRHAPAGSYTQRLFQDKQLLGHKLLEEAQELMEAESREDVAAEAADVMYFTMVKCIQAGVTVKDIESYLDLRAKKVVRRPGNAKDYRIAQASQILGANDAVSKENTEPLPTPPTISTGSGDST